MKKLNIITIHGIRSHGDTIEGVAANALKGAPVGSIVTPIDYTYVPALLHHVPRTRRSVEKYVAVRLHEIALMRPDYENIIMAHSNGSRAASEVLVNAHKLCIDINSYKDFNIKKILIFGSIIPRDFDWSEFSDIEIVNFRGTKDKVVLFSKGWSGRYGFKSSLVKEYKFKGGHSDYATMMLDEIRQEVITT